MFNNIDKFWQELKRRKVIRAVPIYIAASFAIIDAVSNVFPRFGLPDWSIKFVFFLLAIGFVIFIMISWVYDLTPKGVEKTPPISEAKEPVEEKSFHTNAWKFATFLSIFIILLLTVSNISKSKKIHAIDQPEISIAVLPFEALSKEKDQEYFCEGITDVITSQLSKISGFRVPGRTSTLKYKKGDKSITEIGRELNVAYILEGSIQKVGDSIRVTAQLVRVLNEDHLWSEIYDREYSKILAIQSDIAGNVASSLKNVLSTEEKKQIKKKPTNNPVAWDYYLRGNYNLNKKNYDEQDIRNAIGLYKDAIKLDTNFALAYTNLGKAYTTLYYLKYDHSDSCLEKSKEAIDRAFALEPDLLEAYVASGIYYYQGMLDFKKALERFEFVLKKQPDNPDALYYKSMVLRREGKWQKCMAVSRKILKADPLNALVLNNIAITYDYLRNYQEAQVFYNRAIVLRPDWPAFYENKIISIILWKGETGEAWKVLKEAIPLTGSGFLEISIMLQLMDRNYDQAWHLLDQSSSDDFPGSPGEYFLQCAQLKNLLSQPEAGVAYYDSARIFYENELKRYPDNPNLYGSLGISYAGTHNKSKAIKFGKKAVETLPYSRDAMNGPDMIKTLARIYVMTHEYDEALKQIEFLLSIPSDLSVNWLRIDPTWSLLENHAEYRRIMESYSQN